MNEQEKALAKSALIAIYATLRCMQEHYYPWEISELDEFQRQLEAAGLLEHTISPANDAEKG